MSKSDVRQPDQPTYQYKSMYREYGMGCILASVQEVYPRDREEPAENWTLSLQQEYRHQVEQLLEQLHRKLPEPCFP